MKEWIRNTNIYEVNLRQYTPQGTINAFAAHLPRLRDMGVEVLWLMPVTPIAQKNKKGTLGSYYACSDYTSVNPEFGTLADFTLLVQQAHTMGFKVIIDWVANHTGWDHWWTMEHPDWYEKDGQTGDFKKASGMDDIIELNFKNPALRKAMIAAMQFWITETGIDGFRCDLAFWVELDFWIEAKNELERLKPLFWLGELDALEHPEYMQVFDAAYTWAWMHRAEQFYKDHASFADLTMLLNSYSEKPGLPVWFTSNHDENTWNGTEYEKYGNITKALAVFCCTWPGIPMIYSGQELPNYKRLQFFEKDAIEWTDKTELHGFYKTLLGLRTSGALSADAEVKQTGATPAGVLCFSRTRGDEHLLVALNFSVAEAIVMLPKTGKTMQEVFTNEIMDLSEEQMVSLPAGSFCLLKN